MLYMVIEDFHDGDPAPVYRRFRDKTALLHALDERWDEAFRATMEDAVAPERWDGARILEVLTGYIEFSLGQGRKQAELHRAAINMASRDANFAERHRKRTIELHGRLRALLLARQDEIHHADPLAGIEFVLEQLRSMLMARLDASPLDKSLFAASDEEFIDQALTCVSAYLRLEPTSTQQRRRSSEDGRKALATLRVEERSWRRVRFRA